MKQVLGEGLAQAEAPADPLTLAGVAVTLLGVTVAAVAVPAL